jgi:hypothetical protein
LVVIRLRSGVMDNYMFEFRAVFPSNPEVPVRVAATAFVVPACCVVC